MPKSTRHARRSASAPTKVPGFKALMRKDPENTRTLLAARKPKRRIMQTLASATGAEGKTDKDYLAEREAEVRARLKQ